jgi:Xaa-Pro aminopeptidase
MPETHVRRRVALRSLLRERDLDAQLVVDLRNVRYLTGFTGSNAALLVHAGDEPGDEQRTVFCTDGRYLSAPRPRRGRHGLPAHRIREPPGHRRRVRHADRRGR